MAATDGMPIEFKITIDTLGGRAYAAVGTSEAYGH